MTNFEKNRPTLVNLTEKSFVRSFACHLTCLQVWIHKCRWSLDTVIYRDQLQHLTSNRPGVAGSCPGPSRPAWPQTRCSGRSLAAAARSSSTAACWRWDAARRNTRACTAAGTGTGPGERPPSTSLSQVSLREPSLFLFLFFSFPGGLPFKCGSPPGSQWESPQSFTRSGLIVYVRRSNRMRIGAKYRPMPRANYI